MNFDQGAMFTSLTYAELCAWDCAVPLIAVRAEIARRERVMCGDRRVMTPAERLRFAKSGAVCGGEIVQ